MATLQIQPITNEARQSVTVALGETVYVLRLYYQRCSESWFMDLLDETRQTISASRRLSTNTSIFGNIVTGLQGNIVPASLVSPSVELGRNPWGSTHTLVFIEEQ